MTGKASRSTLVRAAFLMATSAIGPEVLTQIAVFTQRRTYTHFGDLPRLWRA